MTKCKNNEVYYTLHAPESVHHKPACNNESCNKSNCRLLNNEGDVEIPAHLSPKPSVRFCNNETAHNISPIVNNVDSPLTTKKLSNDASRRDKNMTNAKTLAASNSSPSSPLRVGNLARASVSVSSPRTSGKFTKIDQHLTCCNYFKFYLLTLGVDLNVIKIKN